MNILYISQLADAGDPRRAAAALEHRMIPVALADLGVEHTFHDATVTPPPTPDGFDGVIVGGSFGSANGQEPWRVALRAWLSEHQRVPLLGICGGHQLLARALGAPVEPCPASQIGVYPLDLPDISGFRACVLQLHHERVGALPPGAELWAADEMGIQALRYGPTRWTVQFHPEMDRALAHEAAAVSGHDASGWQGLDDAVIGGRALLLAWFAAVRAHMGSARQ